MERTGSKPIPKPENKLTKGESVAPSFVYVRTGANRMRVNVPMSSEDLVALAKVVGPRKV